MSVKVNLWRYELISRCDWSKGEMAQLAAAGMNLPYAVLCGCFILSRPIPACSLRMSTRLPIEACAAIVKIIFNIDWFQSWLDSVCYRKIYASGFWWVFNQYSADTCWKYIISTSAMLNISFKITQTRMLLSLNHHLLTLISFQTFLLWNTKHICF